MVTEGMVRHFWKYFAQNENIVFSKYEGGASCLSTWAPPPTASLYAKLR